MKKPYTNFRRTLTANIQGAKEGCVNAKGVEG